jgi:hypothetical protein
MTDVMAPPDTLSGGPEMENPTPKFLTRDEVRNTKDSLIMEPVEVPEWGGTINVRGISGEERDAYESSMLKGQGRKQKVVTDNVRAKLVALASCDEEGKPIFTPKDAEWLGKKSAAALHRVYSVAARLARITDEDVEELVKNSDRDLFGDGR